MKQIQFVILLTAIAFTAQAGPIKDMLVQSPEKLQSIIGHGTYNEVLQLLRDAYAEHMAAPDDPVLAEAYIGIIAQSPAPMQLPLNVDFMLAQPDTQLNAMGAHAIYVQLRKGAPLTPDMQARLAPALKQMLAKIHAHGQAAHDCARYCVYALVLLGDDAWLDAFLTGSALAGNLARKDGWTPGSDAAFFDALAKQYHDVPANDWNKLYESLYQLAKKRRLDGREVKPLQPLVNLDRISVSPG